jgi:VIT1/CCC1 family predicted Fe2+/Mn2+ transporter
MSQSSDGVATRARTRLGRAVHAVHGGALAAGFAAAITESISMGAVGWTSALSERDYYAAEQAREQAEIDATPDAERQEIRDIYAGTCSRSNPPTFSAAPS